MFNKFYRMQHRGSLDEALKTREQISFDKFEFYLQAYDYRVYCYDERISCVRFILNDHHLKPNLPCWILIEVKK